jgi:hypothetical protein
MRDPKIPGGYILISRKVIESEIWDKPPLYIKVWIYLLAKAQHSNFKKLKRGQLFTSIPEIIEACSWKVGYRREKPTKDQIYQVIDWLRKGAESHYESETQATMITTTKATQGLLINIDNYCFYQTSKNYESNVEGNDEEVTRAPRKQRQPDNINKKDKECKNENIIAEIKALRLEYSSENQKLIDQYWLIIKKTRNTNSVSYSVISNTMKQWKKFDQAVIHFALKKHVEAYDDGEHDEKYTLGIMRKTTPEQATDMLNKKTIVKQAVQPLRREEKSVISDIWEIEDYE